jgi:thiamine-phosphate pyrophosphorylase
MPQPSTRLFLDLPPIPNAAQFKPLLLSALGAGNIACVLLRDSGNADTKSAAQALMPLVQAREAAFLVEGDPRLAVRVGADGVHLAYSPDAIETAVSSLGPDAIVGAGRLATRDDAMSAAEAGASYVMFGEPEASGARVPPEHTLERVAWWAEIFNVPCVAYAGALDEIGPLAEAGAEFVALGHAVWEHRGGPADAIKEAQAILINAVPAT